jgi:hypothetical protein
VVQEFVGQGDGVGVGLQDFPPDSGSGTVRVWWWPPDSRICAVI